LTSCTVQWDTQPLIAVFHLRGRLENSLLPMAKALTSARTGVASRISLTSMPASGQPSMLRGCVAAGLRRGEPDRLEPTPDLGYVLDPDPVVLDVLSIRDVGDVPAEVGGDASDGPQLLAGQPAAGIRYPHHEVGVLELLWLEQGGATAIDAGGTLV